jgi:hypothetical protein
VRPSIHLLLFEKSPIPLLAEWQSRAAEQIARRDYHF